MKRDRQQELHFDDLVKQITEDVSRSKWVFSMEDAMQDSALRKSVQKHQRKMKQKTVLEYAIAFPANAGGGAVLLAASDSGRGNASGRRFVCMGTVPCEKIRACRKGVDKHVRIFQKEKSTGAGI